MEEYDKMREFRRKVIMACMVAAIVALLFILFILIRVLRADKGILEEITPSPMVMNPEPENVDILELIFGGEMYADKIAELTGDKGERIAIADVEYGDLAVGRGISGICAGFYDGKPVFCYASDYAAYGKVNRGICFGYAREQSEELFYGMYPVAFVNYYKGERKSDNGGIANVGFVNPEWYVESSYRVGRLMSGIQTDELMRYVDQRYLHCNNLTLRRESFETFLKNFPEENGIDGSYDFTILSVHEADNYTEVAVGLIPLEEDGPLRCNGEWKIVFFKEKETIIPCGIDVLNHADVGIVRESKINLVEEANGKRMESVPIVYGQTTDESGRQIYRFEDGTVIYMDQEK